MPCSTCAAPLPAGAKFCPECGTRVTATSPAAPAAPITRHERRLLTVLFADLVGFTAASDHADPEDVRARVRPFHGLVRQAVAATQGTVARVVGDGVMAVWGYPVAREDDARRAVETALRIRDGLPAAGNDLHARIGVNTGEAVVAFGSADEDADDAMGDAVNVAARLASAATPDSILVGAATRALAGDGLAFEDLDPVRVKGKAEPVPVARVVGRTATGPERAQAGFVGREPELGRILEQLRAAQSDRRLRRVLVVGEPGIGKSRLVGEARSRLSAGGPAWHTGRCRSDVSVPGLALGEVLKGWAGIADDDPPAVAAERLEWAIPSSVTDRAWLVDRIRALVGLATSGPTSRAETFVAWTRALELLAGDRGAVVVIEDVHWADEELLLFLASESLAGAAAPIAMVLTARSEVLEHPSISTTVDATIALAPLDGDALDGLLASVEPSLGLAPGERAAIIRRAGGNPLFTLELVRLRAQQRAAGQTSDDALPETVQAVIAARLDLLTFEARAVAQDAAVIGAAFWPGALNAVTTRGAGLAAALDELQRLELIRRRGDSTLGTEPEFAFRHALVRDVAYGQLTRLDRAVRHEVVARWLSEVAGDRSDLAGVVADHDVRALELFTAAGGDGPPGLPGHAYVHLIRAGRHAEAMDPRAAQERYEQARGLAESPGDALKAMFGIIRALDEQGAYAAELETIVEARELAASLGDRVALGRLLVHASAARRPVGDPRWVDDAKEAVQVLEAMPPSVELVEALAQRSLVELATFEGTTADVQRYATMAIELADRLGVAAPAMAYSRRGFSRAGTGDRGAVEDMRRARELAEVGASGSTLARVISDTGGVEVYFGGIASAELRLREAIGVARRRGLSGVLDHLETNLVYVHRALGRWDEAVAVALPTLVAPVPEDRRFTLEIRASELIFILADRGDVAGVRSMLELMQPGAEAEGGTPELIRGMAWVNLGQLTGDADLVLRGLEGVETRDGDMDFDARSTTEYPALVRAALTAGHPDVVDRFIRSIGAQAPLARTTRELLVGYHAAGMGEHDAAARAFRSAGDQLAAWGFLPEATHARQWLAESELALGREADALARLEDVRAVWTTLRAAAPLGRLECLLASRGLAARTSP